jgi:hypothetical protein
MIARHFNGITIVILIGVDFASYTQSQATVAMEKIFPHAMLKNWCQRNQLRMDASIVNSVQKHLTQYIPQITKKSKNMFKLRLKIPRSHHLTKE